MSGVGFCSECRAGDGFDKSFDDALDGNALGFGAVIEEDAVAEGWIGQCLNVFHCDVRAALEERACFCAENEELSGARSGAPTGPFVDEVSRVRLVWTRSRRKPDGVADHFFGDW